MESHRTIPNVSEVRVRGPALPQYRLDIDIYELVREMRGPRNFNAHFVRGSCGIKLSCEILKVCL